MRNMVCIFCKDDSSASKSIEHILPESIGTRDIVLQRGIVCDKCNNYFARKVEGPLLDDVYFKSIRLFMEIQNKRGKNPIMSCLGPGPARWFIGKSEEDSSIFAFPDERDKDAAMQFIKNNKHGMFIIPHAQIESDMYVMSRFLAKVAIEYLAFKFFCIDNWYDEVIFKEELDALRKFARYGNPGNIWKYSRRRLYDPGAVHVSHIGKRYEVLSEIDVLYTNDHYLFLVVCIFGVEYVISYTSSEYPYRYIDWLKNNNNISPLHSGNNASSKWLSILRE